MALTKAQQLKYNEIYKDVLFPSGEAQDTINALDAIKKDATIKLDSGVDVHNNEALLRSLPERYREQRAILTPNISGKDGYLERCLNSGRQSGFGKFNTKSVAGDE